MYNEYKIYTKSLNSIDLHSNRIINTINPHSYCIASKDLEFKNALKESDILLPDGIVIVFAELFLFKNKIKKIAGYDLFIDLANHLNKKNGAVFFLGSSNDTLDKIKTRFSMEYPNVKISCYSPPFRTNFSEYESLEICDKVNSFKPDVLFVGMTAPKQEKWVHNYKYHLKAKNICCIGAVFDFYAGNINRSSPFWIKLGLEWLPRFLKEPKRLFKRNFVSTPKFILEVLSFKLFGKGIL
jgi:N-acetylglucosaminyldiphosphoundecaprenol N-acetyl-beta-D-mannosaminyltransferase